MCCTCASPKCTSAMNSTQNNHIPPSTIHISHISCPRPNTVCMCVIHSFLHIARGASLFYFIFFKGQRRRQRRRRQRRQGSRTKPEKGIVSEVRVNERNKSENKNTIVSYGEESTKRNINDDGDRLTKEYAACGNRYPRTGPALCGPSRCSSR
jgi:hypothetical protein